MMTTRFRRQTGSWQRRGRPYRANNRDNVPGAPITATDARAVRWAAAKNGRDDQNDDEHDVERCDPSLRERAERPDGAAADERGGAGGESDEHGDTDVRLEAAALKCPGLELRGAEEPGEPAVIHPCGAERAEPLEGRAGAAVRGAGEVEPGAEKDGTDAEIGRGAGRPEKVEQVEASGGNRGFGGHSRDSAPDKGSAKSHRARPAATPPTGHDGAGELSPVGVVRSAPVLREPAEEGAPDQQGGHDREEPCERGG